MGNVTGLKVCIAYQQMNSCVYFMYISSNSIFYHIPFFEDNVCNTLHALCCTPGSFSCAFIAVTIPSMPWQLSIAFLLSIMNQCVFDLWIFVIVVPILLPHKFASAIQAASCNSLIVD